MPKNIAFVSVGGGSSHHMWVFEILKEMHHRGHNISFYSKTDHIRFSKAYPMVKTREVGGSIDFLKYPLVLKRFVNRSIRHLANMAIIEACIVDYPETLPEIKSLFQSERIDLAVCDSFAIACIDAAILLKIPVILTSTLSMFADSDASYINANVHHSDMRSTRDENIWKRIYRIYIETPRHLSLFAKNVAESHALQRKLGLGAVNEASAKRYSHIPKLVNNIFGIEMARKHSPLTHMIGPILQNSYPTLDPGTREFLDNHKRVVYIAFGQHAVPKDQDIDMFFPTLLRLLEQGVIDGVIWASLDKGRIPEKVKTINNREYSCQDIFEHKDFFFPGWAAQFAIFQHPSTLFFVSHGGVGSLHESLFNGKRLFVYPMFGDQPGNAWAVERIGIGKYIDPIHLKFNTKDYEMFYHKLYDVATDPGNKIQETVDRYKRYVQVSTNNAIIRSADIMEESLFASNSQGELDYRYDVGYEIHWIKRYNVDIYAFFAFSSLILLKFAFSLMKSIKSRIKIMHKIKNS
ncbi:hypothetical protein BD770DRAFT_448208 [Pilaira anomala]|nr:hypothetical protein BD770DRAFT_448208 [Pilaira anomala]